MASSVVATLPSPVVGPFESNLNVGGYYTNTYTLTVPTLFANDITSVTQYSYFTQATNLAGKTAFPGNRDD